MSRTVASLRCYDTERRLIFDKLLNRSGSQELPPEEEAAHSVLEKRSLEVKEARKTYTSTLRKRRAPDEDAVPFSANKRNKFEVAFDVVKGCCSCDCLRKHDLLSHVQALRDQFWQLPQSSRLEHLTQVLRECFDPASDKQEYYLCKVNQCSVALLLIAVITS